jgi:hypothetical protein
MLLAITQPEANNTTQQRAVILQQTPTQRVIIQEPHTLCLSKIQLYRRNPAKIRRKLLPR